MGWFENDTLDVLSAFCIFLVACFLLPVAIAAIFGTPVWIGSRVYQRYSDKKAKLEKFVGRARSANTDIKDGVVLLYRIIPFMMLLYIFSAKLGVFTLIANIGMILMFSAAGIWFFVKSGEKLSLIKAHSDLPAELKGIPIFEMILCSSIGSVALCIAFVFTRFI